MDPSNPTTKTDNSNQKEPPKMVNELDPSNPTTKTDNLNGNTILTLMELGMVLKKPKDGMRMVSYGMKDMSLPLMKKLNGTDPINPTMKMDNSNQKKPTKMVNSLIPKNINQSVRNQNNTVE